MINKFYVTGDCHGVFTRFKNLPEFNIQESVGIIVLGDFGINFYLNKTDDKKKKELSTNYSNFIFYCVRGNHEERPQNIPNMKRVYDNEVNGYIYMEEEYPNIRYFLDWGEYKINGYRCLILGGAYSVDKSWRLSRVGLTEETNDPRKSGWFVGEQLTADEMNECDLWLSTLSDVTFDFVFSHTCPKKYQPVDKFLSFIDQSKVDTSMEDWMDKINQKIKVNYAWLWGHFHDDRIEAPHKEMYYHDIEELDIIANRWEQYDNNKILPWWINKSPNFDLF